MIAGLEAHPQSAGGSQRDPEGGRNGGLPGDWEQLEAAQQPRHNGLDLHDGEPVADAVPRSGAERNEGVRVSRWMHSLQSEGLYLG